MDHSQKFAVLKVYNIQWTSSMYICRVCVDFVTLESTFKDLVHGDIFKRQSQGEKKSQYYIVWLHIVYAHAHPCRWIWKWNRQHRYVCRMNLWQWYIAAIYTFHIAHGFLIIPIYYYFPPPLHTFTRPHTHTCLCMDTVEVGLVEDSYTVNESEINVVVCIEVKAGFLMPTESAFVTISTSPGTARGIDTLNTSYTWTPEFVSFVLKLKLIMNQ